MQTFPEFVAHLEKLAEAIHPLLDGPPVDIPGIVSGSLRKRMAAVKTLMPIVKCGTFVEVCLKKFFFLCSASESCCAFESKGLKLGPNIPDFYEIVTAPIMKVCETMNTIGFWLLFSVHWTVTNQTFLSQILNRWFESEPLIATLATDAVIGAMTSPNNPGSGWDKIHFKVSEN